MTILRLCGDGPIKDDDDDVEKSAGTLQVWTIGLEDDVFNGDLDEVDEKSTIDADLECQVFDEDFGLEEDEDFHPTCCEFKAEFEDVFEDPDEENVNNISEAVTLDERDEDTKKCDNAKEFILLLLSGLAIACIVTSMIAFLALRPLIALVTFAYYFAWLFLWLSIQYCSVRKMRRRKLKPTWKKTKRVLRWSALKMFLMFIPAIVVIILYFTLFDTKRIDR